MNQISTLSNRSVQLRMVTGKDIATVDRSDCEPMLLIFVVELSGKQLALLSVREEACAA